MNADEQRWVPRGLSKCARWAFRNLLIAVLGLGVLAAAAWVLVPSLGVSLPQPPPREKKEAPIDGLPIARDERAAQTLQTQKDNEALASSLKEMRAGQQQLGAALANLKAENNAEKAARHQEREDFQKQLAAAQQARQQTGTKQVSTKTGPSAEELRLRTELARLKQQPGAGHQTPRDETYGRFEIFPNKKPDAYPPQPSPHRADIPNLGSGCHAPIRVITGAAVSGRTDKARPILVSIVAPFQCPYQLQGSGRDPIETEIPLQGCFAFFAGGGDLANQRVLGDGQTIGCVMPDKATWERPIKAYLTGPDGNDGLFGTLETHESAAIAKAAATAALMEISAAFGLARSNVVITDGRSYGPQPGQGVQSGLLELQRYFLDQARNLQPTIRASRGEGGMMVMQEGLALDGLPTQILLARGR